MYDNRASKNVKFYECNFFVKFKENRDSIVRLVTRLWAGQPRFKSQQRQEILFSRMPRPALGAYPASCAGSTVFFSGGKAARA